MGADGIVNDKNSVKKTQMGVLRVKRITLHRGRHYLPKWRDNYQLKGHRRNNLLNKYYFNPPILVNAQRVRYCNYTQQGNIKSNLLCYKRQSEYQKRPLKITHRCSEQSVLENRHLRRGIVCEYLKCK